MNPLAYTVTTESITVVYNGKPYTVSRASSNFGPLKDALHREEWEVATGYLTVASGVETWAAEAGGDFTVQGEVVSYQGAPLPEALNSRIVATSAEGGSPLSLMRFWDRLQKNPSMRSVSQLYPFMQHEHIALDEDGFLLTYKSVRPDYMDHHSGTVKNEIGSTHEMPRNRISDDPREACHFGFHVGALAYAAEFGGSDRRVLICKVDPADVVCVPYDCSQQKVRVSKYTVLGHYGGPLPSTSISNEDLGVEDDDDEKLCEECDNPLDECTCDDEDEEYLDQLEDDQRQADRALVQKPKAEKKAAKPADVLSLDTMDEVDLMNQPLDVLRGYAAKNLKIVGASKIPGGKRALVLRILEVRRS